MNPHFQRGALLFQQGRPREAMGELRQALGQGGDDASTHALLALCLSDLEDFAPATEHAEQAVHLAPEDAYSHYALARVMMVRNRVPEAEAAIAEAIRLDPADADYFGVLAHLQMRQSQWAAALETANRGLGLEPEHGLCTNMRAQALVQLGDRNAAAATMAQALARRPDDPLAHANQGWSLLHLGEPQQAMEHFREALRLDPELDWARAGIVEAMKARNPIYRLLLAWFLWMGRLQPRVRWGLILGALFGQRLIGDAARRSPEWAPVLWPVLYCYFAFVLLSWIAPSLFDLLLRLDKFGRHALSDDQRKGANVIAGCLGATLLSLAAYFASGESILLLGSLLLALLCLPASAIYACDAGSPRRTMTQITLALLAAIVIVIGVGLFAEQLPEEALALGTTLMRILPLALLASQFAAMRLVRIKPQR